MEEITTIGLDIAKHVFQVHGVDVVGNVAIKRRLRRAEVLTFFAKLQPTLIGIEACATSHYWARELSAMGHNVKLMPPHYVKPYVKRQKNDMTDAAALCEAVTRPSMQFVPLKSEAQQAVLMLHRSASRPSAFSAARWERCERTPSISVSTLWRSATMRVSRAGRPASSDLTMPASSAMSFRASSTGISSRERSAIRSSISSARASRTRLSAADLADRRSSSCPASALLRQIG
jgi:hypothetical protein